MLPSKSYSLHIEQKMLKIFRNLSERDRRLYAAIEAEKLPYGGKTYIAKVLGCSRTTIEAGIQELNTVFQQQTEGIRVQGGGRKKSCDNYPCLLDEISQIMQTHYPDTMKVNQQDIVRRLHRKRILVSKYVVKQLLVEHGYLKTKIVCDSD